MSDSLRILIVAHSRADLQAIQISLEAEGYEVYATRSTLRALEMVKAVPLAAVVCGLRMQIGDALSFPQWILSEVGHLPSYFIISEELAESEVVCHKNFQMISGVLRGLGEVGRLRALL